jgi:hypothetical protein
VHSHNVALQLPTITPSLAGQVRHEARGQDNAPKAEGGLLSLGELILAAVAATVGASAAGWLALDKVRKRRTP